MLSSTGGVLRASRGRDLAFCIARSGRDLTIGCRGKVEVSSGCITVVDVWAIILPRFDLYV